MSAVIAAISFVWLGMVLAISFLEAPLKFRAPDVTLRIGLGIGRLVFKALNVVEVLFAVVIAVVLVMSPHARGLLIAAVVAIVALIAQLVAVRPALTKRSDAVLAGAEPSKSHTHLAYIALELVKVVALLVGGVLALGS